MVLPAHAMAEAPVSSEWLTWYEDRRRFVDGALAAHLAQLKGMISPHSRLLDAVEYSLVAGGKRLRPVLVLECCRLCGGSNEVALPAALAIECVHTFSLIHDDLPAMDDDDLRRGRPTNHKVFGEGMAVLAGDWLLAHAFELISPDKVGEHRSAAWVEALAAGTLALIAGQGADIDGAGRAPDRELIEYMHEHKTARLIEASCRLGALGADAQREPLTALADYGRHLGLAFQITDDLLDCTGSAAQVGKRVGKDAAASKQTYPAAFGLPQSRTRVHEEIAAALAALRSFGSAADHLRVLAHYVVGRNR